MTTQLKRLTPSVAWEEAQNRSLAIGIAGWVLVGCLNAAGAIPEGSRPWLGLSSGLESAFLTALAIMLAYYHDRWLLGFVATTLALSLPYSVNLLWTRISGRSLIYPVVVVGFLGVVSLWATHYKISGPRWEDDAELESALRMMEDFRPTWVHRVGAICFVTGIVLLLILMLR